MARGMARMPVGLTSLMFTLTACGGGGGGGSVASVPPPPAAPAPTPDPSPTTVASTLGLTSQQPFATTYKLESVVSTGTVTPVAQSDSSQPLEFRYDAASGDYLIKLPGQEQGRLAPTFRDHVSSINQVVTDKGPIPNTEVHLTASPLRVFPQTYSYTSWGTWYADSGRTTSDGRTIRDYGTFAYGIPTAAGDVPLTGSASYTADLNGNARFTGSLYESGQSVVGMAHFTFDFSRGALSGYMEPSLTGNGFNAYGGPLGRFDFRDTVYSKGATTFSGLISGPGAVGTGSGFEGLFTGPNAAEIMGKFSTAFEADMKVLYTGSTQIDHLVGTLSGIFVGKRD